MFLVRLQDSHWISMGLELGFGRDVMSRFRAFREKKSGLGGGGGSHSIAP